MKAFNPNTSLQQLVERNATLNKVKDQIGFKPDQIAEDIKQQQEAVAKLRERRAAIDNYTYDEYHNFEHYQSADSKNLKVVTYERLEKIKESIFLYYELWLAYPDLLLDTIVDENSPSLYFYQRLFIRACFRFRYHYGTFTRGYSKSFLSVLALYLQCMLLPRSKRFSVADVKGQAIRIATEKIYELWEFWPILQHEMHEGIGKKPLFNADNIRLVFKNNSKFDVVTMTNSARGGRRHGGILEEVRDMDEEKINSVVLPLMNIRRSLPNGSHNPLELHRSQIYITTAGEKGTFAYEKAIEVLAMSILRPDLAMCWGGSYYIPVAHGLMAQEDIDEVRTSSTYKESLFLREYMSVWTGGSEDSFFDYDKLQKYRKIILPEHYSKIPPNNKSAFYVMACDIGRLNDGTSVIIFKVFPQKDKFVKKIVNVMMLPTNMHFQDQAAWLKDLAYKFNVEAMVIDGNGLGVGLLDFMTMESVHPITREVFPPIGSMNDPDMLSKQPYEAERLIYVIKAGNNAGDIHMNCLNQVYTGNVKFLIDDRNARDLLMNTKKGQRMSMEERETWIQPYQLTTILLNEMTNLRMDTTNQRILKLVKINNRLSKDKFSALEYGLWYIKTKEEKYYDKRSKNRQWASFVMGG